MVWTETWRARRRHYWLTTYLLELAILMKQRTRRLTMAVVVVVSASMVEES